MSVSLRGSACQVLGTLPLCRCDYRELVRALGSRFNPENQSELYRVQLRNRGRKVNESLPELGQQIRTLVAQAYPGANPEVLEVLGRDFFIDAIDDPDIRWRIYQTKPENLDGAICTAVEFQAYKTAEKQRLGGKRFVRDIAAMEGTSTSADFKESVIKKLEERINELQKQLQLSKSKTKFGGYQKGYNRKENPSLRCWNCGEAGHVKYNCSTEQSN